MMRFFKGPASFLTGALPPAQISMNGALQSTLGGSKKGVKICLTGSERACIVRLVGRQDAFRQ